MSTIQDTLTNGLTEGIKGIIRSCGTDPATIDAAVKDLATRQADIVDDAVRQQNDSQKQAIMLAELTQGDSYTRSARPTVVYAGLAFILVIHVFIPFLAFVQGKHNPDDLKLPPEFWWAWTGVVSVWVVGRSYEKVNGATAGSAVITGTQSPSASR